MSRTTSFVLTSEIERVVTRHLSSGRYVSASEVLRAGLRALEAEEVRSAALLQAIDEGRSRGREAPFSVELDEPTTSDLRVVAKALLATAAVARDPKAPRAHDLVPQALACTRVAAWLDTRIHKRLLVLHMLAVEADRDVADG